jgi:hypothetical protein
MTVGTINKLSVFLLGYNSQSLAREKVTTFLDENPHFQNWLALLPGQIFIISESNIEELASILRSQFLGQLIFITKLDPLASDGLLPEDIWSFINNPTSAKAEEVNRT